MMSKKFSALKYERHIELPGFGSDAQQKLADSRVCIIGAGGLGCPVSLYLSAAGVGELTIVDDDVVSVSNLQRQILYRASDEGYKKTDMAQARLEEINPQLSINTISGRLDKVNCTSILNGHSLVIDCSDNYDTRYLVNETSMKLGITLVSGAVVHYAGQIFVFKEGFPCYECFFPTRPDQVTAPVCTQAGVLGPVVGVVGTLMAVEAIKEISSVGETLAGSFLIYNALKSEVQRVRVSPSQACIRCSKVISGC